MKYLWAALLGLVLSACSSDSVYSGPFNRAAPLPAYPGATDVSYTEDGDRSASWLQVTGGDELFPEGARTSPLGLHVVDYNLTLGDLTELVRVQSAAWLARR